MADKTHISWCDATFNPWLGCQAVSPACDHCYADALVTRFGGDFSVRKRTSAANWKQPLIWNRRAEKLGIRYRVFCASLADVFDNKVPTEWRLELWALIHATPHLDWLLLTKRPQNITKMLPAEHPSFPAWGDGWPNVRLGTTVENQTEADRRIPFLLSVPAKVHFLSCEPLLGPVDLMDDDRGPLCGYEPTREQTYGPHGMHYLRHGAPKIDWVICGGESGKDARPMHPDWARSLRDQCVEAGTPFNFKQHGEWLSAHDAGFSTWERTERKEGLVYGRVSGWKGDCASPLGGRDFETRYPFPLGPDPGPVMIRVGKRAAGRLLDGREWNEVPG